MSNTLIEVEYENEVIKGTLIKKDNKYFTIKLSSGYNVNLDIKKVKIISQKEKVPIEKVSKSHLPSLKNLPKIHILHTGGTIASKVDHTTGAVSSSFTDKELLSLYPELNEIANIETRMIGNIFSGDINFSHHNLFLEEISNSIELGCEGIILSHGTDTIQYTAPILQYCLENLPVPVIIVGAQRSSDRPSSDSYLNLKTAIDFILDNNSRDKKFLRVGVCMHGSISDNVFNIYDSINVRKMHTSRRDAFKQINYLPYAKIENTKIEILRPELQSISNSNKFNHIKIDSVLKIGFFKSHPNMIPEEIKNLAIYDCVIIEGTGFGHLPVDEIDEYTKNNSLILKEVELLAKKIPVIMSSQCIYGSIKLNVYSYGRHLQNAGVIGNHNNLCPETLFMRATYLLSKDSSKFKENWGKNLEGFEVRAIDDFDSF